MHDRSESIIAKVGRTVIGLVKRKDESILGQEWLKRRCTYAIKSRANERADPDSLLAPWSRFHGEKDKDKWKSDPAKWPGEILKEQGLPREMLQRRRRPYQSTR